MVPAMPAPNKNGIQKLDTVTEDDTTRSHVLDEGHDDHEEKTSGSMKGRIPSLYLKMKPDK
ncbi:hypothetical protein JCM14469_10930 [Desulfatiferula olefinivorans]